MSGFSGGRSTTPAKPRPGIDGRSPARNALRSIPAQNVPPAPVMTPATRRGLGVEPVHGRPDRLGGHRVDRVARLGAVDGDDQDARLDAGADRSAHRGAIRIAPSSRIVSPLSIGLSTMCIAVEANSVGLSETRGVRHLGGQPLLDLVREPAEDRRVEDAGCDRAHPDQRSREVPRRDQRHPDDAGLGRRVGDLADLALPRGDRRGEDADAALAVDRLVRGHPRRREPQHVERAHEVDVDDLAVEVVVAGRAVPVRRAGPSRRDRRSAPASAAAPARRPGPAPRRRPRRRERPPARR